MGLRQRLRYRFDNLMARGVGAQMLLLAAFTAIAVVITAIALIAFDVVPANDKGDQDSFGMLAWKSLMHSLDTGTIAGDAASWTFLFIMLFATLSGLFVVSALIGVINQGFGTMLDGLRRGKSVVVERDHTVILGWGPKIFTLLRELAEANRNQRKACVVILADRDKVAMDAEIASVMHGTKLRIVTRRGSSMATADLALVSLATSKAVIVLAPDHAIDGAVLLPHESDTIVLKTLLAIAKRAGQQPLHLVAEIFDERSGDVARLVAGDKAALILAAPLISRLLVQTGRQSGLSVVYTELLDFEGVEIYMTSQPKLTGKTFREAVFAYDTSTVIGLLTAADEMLVPPPFDHKLADGDQILVISEDDDTIMMDGGHKVDDAAVVAKPPAHQRRPERTLVLGASPRLPSVLVELDAYVAEGSVTIVIGDGDVTFSNSQLRNMHVTAKAGDVTDHTLLESLDVPSFDHVLLLSETGGRTQEMADARTTITLLYLRDIERRSAKKVPITSEILDIQNRDLASIAEADDFIVSNTLVSLMVSQVAENPHLARVFDELFTAGGHELYLKPATEYVRPGEVSFGTITEAALRREEIAIGYRLAATAKDPEASFGVTVNPSKRSTVKLGADDKIIVLAED